jgi:hypothetical protein
MVIFSRGVDGVRVSVYTSVNAAATSNASAHAAKADAARLRAALIGGLNPLLLARSDPMGWVLSHVVVPRR